MKYIVLVGDGMSDYPLEKHDGKTPLEISHIPSMDALAQTGVLGLVRTIPVGMDPGSDIANLSVMGYDPGQYYTGRAPIEAAGIGVELSEHDVAFRCNLVTLKEQNQSLSMEDYSAGHISTQEACEIIDRLKAEFDSDQITFYPGVSYRHLMVWKDGHDTMKTTPPHDISGKPVAGFLPNGEGAPKILGLMKQAQRILNDFPVTLRRKLSGKNPANAIWLWGQGKLLKIPRFFEKYRLTGSVISAVDLIKGLGLSAGLHSIDVPGATGYLDTNYEGKVEAALTALETVDFVYLHVEAPDEASHKGSFEEKVLAIEDFDSRIVLPIKKGLEGKFKEYRIMVLPDHPTPLSIKTHAPDPVPFVVCDPQGRGTNMGSGMEYNEKNAAKSGIFVDEGWRLMDRFIQGD